MKKAIATGLASSVAALALIAPGGATAAQGDKAEVTAKLKLTSDNTQPSPDFFEGSVKSGRGFCEKEARKVKLVQNGDLIATTELSNGKFEFQVANPHAADPYRAKVKKSEKCQKAVSNEVVAEGT